MIEMVKLLASLFSWVVVLVVFDPSAEDDDEDGASFVDEDMEPTAEFEAEVEVVMSKSVILGKEPPPLGRVPMRKVVRRVTPWTVAC